MIYIVSGYSTHVKEIVDYGYFGSEKDAKNALANNLIEEFKETFTIRTIGN